MFPSHYIKANLRKVHGLIYLLLCLPLFLPATSTASPPEIVVSIKPLHSLISHITDGVSQTRLLLDKQQSPHHFQLRPSQKRMLNQAELFFYSSNNLESFVENLKDSSGKLQFIELSTLAEIKSLKSRGFHSHNKNHSDEHNNEQAIDGHIWLSIENAQHISSYVTQILSRLDPDNAAQYHKNLQSLLIKLHSLKNTNLELLVQVKTQAFLVHHDAYQYFELENQLTRAHFVTTSPEHTPGIKRIKELRQLIKSENIQCIFYQPPNVPALIQTLTENSSIKLAPIDPAGSQIAAGKQHYFTLMRQTASILYECLNNT